MKIVIWTKERTLTEGKKKKGWRDKNREKKKRVSHNYRLKERDIEIGERGGDIKVQREK